MNYTIDDFTPSGILSYLNDHGEILHQTPLKEVFNLRWYIQHLMDENEDEARNPLLDETDKLEIYQACHSSQTFYDS